MHSHSDLVKIAEKWLKKRCGVVFTELYSMNAEIPDAIGFTSMTSILIECKTSRRDFVNDFKKPHRWTNGMGEFRFYLCPESLINIEDLPDGWGLIWVCEKGKSTVIFNPYGVNNDQCGMWRNGFERNLRAEMNCMYTVLRKLTKNKVAEY